MSATICAWQVRFKSRPSTFNPQIPDMNPFESWLVKVPGILKFHIGFWSHFLILWIAVWKNVIPKTVRRRKKIYGPAGRRFGWLTASDLRKTTKWKVSLPKSLYFLFPSRGDDETSTVLFHIFFGGKHHSYDHCKQLEIHKKSWCVSIFIGYYAILASLIRVQEIWLASFWNLQVKYIMSSTPSV